MCVCVSGRAAVRGVWRGLGDICSSFSVAANTKAIKVTEVKSTHGMAAAHPPHTYHPLAHSYISSLRNSLHVPMISLA